MRGAVVHHPEHPAGRGVGFGGHDLVDQPTERGDAGGGLTAAEPPGLVDVPGGQIGQRPAPFVLVLDPHGAGHPGRQGGVAAAAGLDGGLLVGRDDELARLQPPPLEPAGGQVHHPPGLGGEVGIAGKDPGAVPPRLERVLVQPAPQRGHRDLVDQAGGDDLLAQLAQAPAAKRHGPDRGQLTGDRLHLDDHRRGGTGAAGPAACDPPTPKGLPRQSACATSTPC